MPKSQQTQYPQPALGKAIRQLREEQGTSLDRLGRVAGVAPNTLSLIERGEANPTWETVKRIGGSARRTGLDAGEGSGEAEGWA